MKLILSVVVSVYILSVLGRAAFGKGKLTQNIDVIKQYRPAHVVKSIPVLAAVIGTAVGLNQIPLFRKNPIKLVFSWIFGNSSDGGSNFLFTGIEWKPYAVVMLTIFLLAIPSLAREEEHMFRQGTIGWKDGIIRSIVFGLVHMIMLISVGTALALSIGGLWFTHQYFKGGTQRSTIYHSVYNSMLVMFLLVTVVVT